MWLLCNAVFLVPLLVVIVKSENEKFLVFSKSKVTWYQALIECKRIKRELATINSEKEELELDNFLLNNNFDKTYWMGATKEGNGEYYWATTGEKMNYTFWVNGQPDNTKYDLNWDEGEHCLAWTVQSNQVFYGWNDVTCLEPHYYICQKFEDCD
ncbi:perlucin-like [Anthonomus grandis grandis]|uniref:perlucin-like n=1 Tax=Anthonomus grandis grandis TaxID=2921223 RepID=UPI002165025E|nr:perlucin-like [Anthonomus grandis grandis]